MRHFPQCLFPCNCSLMQRVHPVLETWRNRAGAGQGRGRLSSFVSGSDTASLPESGHSGPVVSLIFPWVHGAAGWRGHSSV